MIEELKQEQEKYRYFKRQLNFRSRTLWEYDWHLGFENDEFFVPMAHKSLLDIVKDEIKKKDKAVWIDLGCGSALHFREAKLALDYEGIDPNKLVTIGYDLFEPNIDSIKVKIEKRLVDENILLEKYDPLIINEDISCAQFIEQPDLVTSCKVLYWTRDPLKVIRNVSQQIKPGTIFAFDTFSALFYNDKTYYLKDKIWHDHGTIPGFDWLGTKWSYQPSGIMFLVRNEDKLAFDYELRSAPDNEDHRCYFIYVDKNKS